MFHDRTISRNCQTCFPGSPLAKYNKGRFQNCSLRGGSTDYASLTDIAGARRVWIEGFHKLLQDLQQRQAADTAAIQSEKIQLLARHLLLFGLESSLFGNEEWNILDANSATIPPGAVSLDLDWTANNNPDDIFGLDSDSLHPLDGDDLEFDNSAIAIACVNQGLQPLRQRRVQNQMQCETEPPNEVETRPENIETTSTMASLYGHELCLGYGYLLFAVCDSGNRFGRQVRGDDVYFDLTSCTICELVVVLSSSPVQMTTRSFGTWSYSAAGILPSDPMMKYL
ncbi:hypothetical protein MMC29_004402 [Sticta canariensis]|nr:hypothetical protein [Sticta canariensis]